MNKTVKKILHRKSFHIAGILASLWPIGIAIFEVADCHPDWRSMCGTMQVFLNPPGYILSLPLIYTVGIFADAIGGTAGYLIIVGCIAITHYFIGGLIGIGIAKLVPKL